MPLSDLNRTLQVKRELHLKYRRKRKYNGQVPMRKKRLTLLTTYLTSEQAGGAKAVSTLARELARHPDLETTLCCVTLDREQYPPELNIVQMPPISSPRFLWRVPSLYLIGAWKKSLKAVSLPPPDLIYGNSMHLTMAARAMFPQVPIVTHPGAVVVSREVRHEFEGSALYREAEAALCDRIERRMYQEPEWTHLVSTPLVARDRAEYFGIPPETFKVMPLGIDPERFRPPQSPAETRRDLGLDPEMPIVITTARLVGWKRVDMVLDALSTIPARFQYIVVGDGPARAALEDRAHQAGLDGRVHFVGWQDPAKYLQAADVFVLPSMIESFGLVYAEAMMTGLACIGSRHDPPDVISSAQDVIEDGVSGFVCGGVSELRDKLQILLADPELRRRMGKAGRARACAEFSVGGYVAKLRDLIQT